MKVLLKINSEMLFFERFTQISDTFVYSLRTSTLCLMLMGRSVNSDLINENYKPLKADWDAI